MCLGYAQITVCAFTCGQSHALWLRPDYSVCLHLWPISCAMVTPRSNPVSSVMTQLHWLVQTPPNCVTPLTSLFPSGRTRSNLWQANDKRETRWPHRGSVMETKRPRLRSVWSLTVWCRAEGLHVEGLCRWLGWPYDSTDTHSAEKRRCWWSSGSQARGERMKMREVTLSSHTLHSLEDSTQLLPDRRSHTLTKGSVRINPL